MILNLRFSSAISKFIPLLFLLICSVSYLNGQSLDKAEIKDFKIEILNTDSGIEMTSSEGSAWKSLSFSLKPGTQQAVNANGMTTIKEDSKLKDSAIADYLFTIEKDNKGYVILKGIRGTNWTNLSFSSSLRRPWTLDQNGISSN